LGDTEQLAEMLTKRLHAIMSKALEDACKALHINGQVHDREVIATRIIDLARTGVIDTKALSERVIAETLAMRSL
jgi:hypothetical protein